jgi:ribose 5-phosphate isomerase B
VAAVALGADHAGFELKEALKKHLEQRGVSVADFGTNSRDSTDYPDYAQIVGHSVASHKAQFGVLICTTGVGMSIAANKIPGIRAALAHDDVTARRSREHNHCNILCLGTDLLSGDQIRAIVEIFLNTPYESGRHDRRVDKIRQIEQQY